MIALILIMALYLTKSHLRNILQEEMPANPLKTQHSTKEELEELSIFTRVYGMNLITPTFFCVLVCINQ